MTSSQTRAGTDHQAATPALSQFGLGFWQAWWTIAFCSNALMEPGAQLIPGIDSQTLMFAITTLGYAVVLLAGKKGILHSYTSKACIMTATLCVVGSVGMAFTSRNLLGPASLPIFLVASAFFSVGNALLLALWGDLWGSLASGRVGRCLYSSYIMALLILFAVKLIPTPAQAVIASLLPAISCLVLSHSQAEPRRMPREEAFLAETPIPRAAIARAFAGAIILNFVWGLGLPSLGLVVSGGSDSLNSFVVSLIGLVCLYAYVAFRNPAVEALTLYAPIGVALGSGMLLASLLPEGLGFIGFGITALGGFCLDMLVMLGSTDVAFRMRRSASAALSLTMLISRCGSLLGRIAYDALIVPGRFSAFNALLVCVLLVLVCCLVIFTSTALKDLYRSEPPTNNGKATPTEICNAFAHTHGLTPREREVLELLVRGRSAPYIAQELSIALGTVKNHISGIYRKVGVGDRQSLLNEIESEAELAHPNRRFELFDAKKLDTDNNARSQH